MLVCQLLSIHVTHGDKVINLHASSSVSILQFKYWYLATTFTQLDAVNLICQPSMIPLKTRRLAFAANLT